MKFDTETKKEMFTDVREFVGDVYEINENNDVVYEECARDSMYEIVGKYCNNLKAIESTIEHIARFVSNLHLRTNSKADANKKLDRISSKICKKVEKEVEKCD